MENNCKFTKKHCNSRDLATAGRSLKKLEIDADEFDMLMLALIESVNENRAQGYDIHADKYMEIYEKLRDFVPRGNEKDLVLGYKKFKL